MIKSSKLAIGALVLLVAGAASLATAAEPKTTVGTFDRHEDRMLYVQTDDGLWTFSTAGIDVDPTFAKGDPVRVSYRKSNGTRDALIVSRAYTVSVILPNRAGIEQLVIEDVQSGTLESIAGKDNVRTQVMLANADLLTLRTADPDVEPVAFRARRPAGSTEFRQGEVLRLKVPAPTVKSVAIENAMADPEPIPAPPEPVEDTMEPAADPEPMEVTETAQTAPEPEATAVTAVTDEEPADGYANWQDDQNYRLPQTASPIHAIGVAGLAALAGAALLGLAARRLW